MPNEILRVYDQYGTPCGYFLPTEENNCQVYCYIYGFTYKKEKVIK